MIVPVILAGGSGTRLWPASRKSFPKQFANLIGDRTLYQSALLRLTGRDFDAPLVMTASDFRFLAADQAEAVGCSDVRIFLEPEARNTAAPILTAALQFSEKPDTMMLVAPSDHLIGNTAQFHDAVRAGIQAAKEGRFVTFGVPPERPETGFGYLQLQKAAAANEAVGVKQFVEKPDLATAEALVSTNSVFWNAGIFLCTAATVIEAFERQAPHLVALCRSALDNGGSDLSFFRLEETAYKRLPDISFDTMVMEHANNIAAVALNCGWSDLGSWQSLRNASDPDSNGNVTSPSASAIDCTNTLLRTDDPNVRLVGLGLDNIATVVLRDAVLVADLQKSQDVRAVVEHLRQQNAPQADAFPRFHRPWGWYETLCLGERFQVKRIMVKPGGVLSLQTHIHRAEHWVVVAGTAKVTIEAQEKLISENQSIYIPLGSTHRMENPGKVPMHLIEVQTGSYLGEDDIVRYEDIYARKCAE